MLFMGPNPGEIPRFARNDKNILFGADSNTSPSHSTQFPPCNSRDQQLGFVFPESKLGSIGTRSAFPKRACIT
jgi:hypothetical protein